ncbi:MAG: hypothetical protein AB1413_07010 [Thermodesulfobacteriota bacterium]
MKKTFPAAVACGVLACLVAQPSLASCPNIPASCDYLAVGWQGTCFHLPNVCKPCGPKHCPDLPGSFRDMPQQINTPCLDKIIKAGRIDGCSVPEKIDPMYRHVFKAACDEHDVCYHSDTAKAHCDNDFRDNMLYICDHYYKGAANAFQEKACEDAALIFYGAVSIGGQNGYDKDQKWKKEHCSE